MKKILSSLLYLLLAAPLLAQRDIPLPGLVVRQNSRVKTGQVEYLSKVSIQATQAAAPTMSDATGAFTLVFADQPAYNATRIFAEKSDMEVVNKTDLERAAVIGRLDKLKIVMCPVGELMESQMQYYGIAQEAIVSRFKKRIAALEATNANLDKLIAEINDEYNLQLKTKNEAIYALEKEWSEALASAQETAQKFAAINLDDADSLYLQADAAFKKGDFTRVLQLLQYDLLDKNLRNIRSNLSAADSLSTEGRARIARGQENLRQTIQNALFAARVAKLDGAWKRAEAYYDLAVKGDEGDANLIAEAASFMQLQNQFAKAGKYLEKTLQIYRQLAVGTPESYLPNLAATLNDLGLLLFANNEMIESKKNHEEALRIFTQLSIDNPLVYLPYVALTFSNLGNWFYINNDSNNAEQCYEKALQIQRKFAEINPDIYLANVAMVLNNLGALLYSNNKIIRAKQSYEESLQVYRKMTEKNPDAYLPFLAMTLNNLGLLLKKTNNILAAQKAYEEALQIRRKLSEKNSGAYLHLLGETLINLGVLLSDNNNITNARESYEEAMKIYRQLSVIDPNIYLKYVAKLSNNLGNMLSDNNNIVESKRLLEEACQIYRQLAKNTPDVYLPEVAMTLNNYGLCLIKDIDEIDNAEKAYLESLTIYRELVQKNSDTYLPYLAKILNNIGGLAFRKNDIVESKKYCEEALRIYRDLSEKNIETYMPDLALTLNNYASFLYNNDEVLECNKAYEESIRIYRLLASRNPDTYLPGLAMALLNWGDFLTNNKYISRAKKPLEEALVIYRVFAKQSPDFYLPDVANSLNKLGLWFCANIKLDSALIFFKESLYIYEQLANKNPKNYNIEVSTMNINISIVYGELLKNSGDMSLKVIGLGFVEDANQRLMAYADEYSGVKINREKIKKLKNFFKEFNQSTFKLNQKLKYLIVLEEQNKVEKDIHQRVVRQEEIIDILNDIEKDMPNNQDIKKEISNRYGTLSWYQIFDKQFAVAEQSARKGLNKDSNLEWISTVLSISLLYQGKWEEAELIYINLKDKKNGNLTYKESFLMDLDALEKEGITHPDVQKARALLKN